jgi:hypothetical protein
MRVVFCLVSMAFMRRRTDMILRLCRVAKGKCYGKESKHVYNKTTIKNRV